MDVATAPSAPTTIHEVRQDYAHRLGRETIQQCIELQTDGTHKNIRRLDQTVLALHEAMPLTGQMKILDSTKRALVATALPLEQELIGNARITYTSSAEDWNQLEDEAHGIEELFTSSLQRVAPEHATSLEEAYTENIICVIDAAIESNTHSDQTVDLQLFEAFKRKRKRSITEAISFFEKLIPIDAPTPLADRRPPTQDVVLDGFEFNCLYPSNHELAQMVTNNKPPVLTDRTMKLVYFDRSLPHKAATVRAIGDDDAQIEIYHDISPELIERTIRHELGHVPVESLIPLDDRNDFVLSVQELITADQQQVGHDIFSYGLSSYPLTEQQRNNLFRLAQETIAEVWFMANNDKLLNQLRTQFPNTYRILKIFYAEETISKELLSTSAVVN